MDIKRQFLKTINKYNMVRNGDRVIVGVSGGPDSICLLHLFMTLRDGLGIFLYVAHLDHMFRGKESAEDASFVKALCHKWGIPFFGDKVDVPKHAKKTGLSPEDAARRIRYDFFNRVKAQTGSEKIATGHNRNDHEETILMNILRGAGLDGLIGIDPIRDFYIRPLVEIPRHAIEKYLSEEKIPFRIDKTNLTEDYFRNSIRLGLIPLIQKKYCPHLGQSLRRLSEIARRDLSFMEAFTEEARTCIMGTEAEKIMIDVKGFLEQHEAIKYRLVRTAVEKLTGNVKDFEIRHVRLVVHFIEKALPGSIIDLPKNLRGVKDYGHFVLSKKDFNKTPKYSYILTVPGDTIINETGVIIKTCLLPYDEKTVIKMDSSIAYLDYDKISSDLVVRNRRSGDRFRPLGGIGLKKLKNFLIDEKVPRRKRNYIPIVEVADQIVWVGGMRIDDRFKVTRKTKRILVLTMERI